MIQYYSGLLRMDVRNPWNLIPGFNFKIMPVPLFVTCEFEMLSLFHFYAVHNKYLVIIFRSTIHEKLLILYNQLKELWEQMAVNLVLSFSYSSNSKYLMPIPGWKICNISYERCFCRNVPKRKKNNSLNLNVLTSCPKYTLF